MGQERPVQVYILVTEGTFEDTKSRMSVRLLGKPDAPWSAAAERSGDAALEVPQTPRDIANKRLSGQSGRRYFESRLEVWPKIARSRFTNCSKAGIRNLLQRIDKIPKFRSCSNRSECGPCVQGSPPRFCWRGISTVDAGRCADRAKPGLGRAI